MEFPDLGKYCHFKECKRLDFLPFKCDLCQFYFCAEHWKYEAHKCSELTKKKTEKIVPVCPLCGQVLSVPQNQNIDAYVNQHIESGCRVERKEKNVCSYKGCKKSEVYNLICPSCHQNFCFIHRQMELHNCPGLRKQHQQSSWTQNSLSETKKSNHSISNVGR